MLQHFHLFTRYVPQVSVSTLNATHLIFSLYFLFLWCNYKFLFHVCVSFHQEKAVSIWNTDLQLLIKFLRKWKSFYIYCIISSILVIIIILIKFHFFITHGQNKQVLFTPGRPVVLSVHSWSCRINSIISSGLNRFISVMELRTSNHNSTIVTFKVCLYLSYFVSQGLFETCSDITVAAANGGLPATSVLSWFCSSRVSCSCFSLLPFWRGFSWLGSHNWAQ